MADTLHLLSTDKAVRPQNSAFQVNQHVIRIQIDLGLLEKILKVFSAISCGRQLTEGSYSPLGCSAKSLPGWHLLTAHCQICRQPERSFAIGPAALRAGCCVHKTRAGSLAIAADAHDSVCVHIVDPARALCSINASLTLWLDL